MVKRAYSWTIVSLAPSGHEESYLPTIKVQKEKDAEAETERAFRGRVDRLEVADAQIWNFLSQLKIPRPRYVKAKIEISFRNQEDQKIPIPRQIEYSEMEIIYRGRDEQNIPNILIKKIAE